MVHQKKVAEVDQARQEASWAVAEAMIQSEAAAGESADMGPVQTAPRMEDHRLETIEESLDRLQDCVVEVDIAGQAWGIAEGEATVWSVAAVVDMLVVHTVEDRTNT